MEGWLPGAGRVWKMGRYWSKSASLKLSDDRVLGSNVQLESESESRSVKSDSL